MAGENDAVQFEGEDFLSRESREEEAKRQERSKWMLARGTNTRPTRQRRSFAGTGMLLEL